jgi:hypothetical protein
MALSLIFWPQFVRHPPFPNACSALRAYRLCFPLWSSTLSRFHAGASLAGPPRIISVPSFLLCGHLLVRCSFAIVFIIAVAYHGCAITLLTIILIGASVPYTFFELFDPTSATLSRSEDPRLQVLAIHHHNNYLHLQSCLSPAVLPVGSDQDGHH